MECRRPNYYTHNAGTIFPAQTIALDRTRFDRAYNIMDKFVKTLDFQCKNLYLI